jgi:hypothetical protein
MTWSIYFLGILFALFCTLLYNKTNLENLAPDLLRQMTRWEVSSRKGRLTMTTWENR